MAQTWLWLEAGCLEGSETGTNLARCGAHVLGLELGPSELPQDVKFSHGSHAMMSLKPHRGLEVRCVHASCKIVSGQTLVDLGISSQIVICLLFACDYLRYIVLHLCITQIPGEYRINCISLLILSIFFCSVTFPSLTK